MLTRRSDGILLAIALLLISWSFLLLYSRTSGPREGMIIGQMIESNLQVRSRLAKSLTWKDIIGKTGLVDDQYIFTGDEAFAKIKLNSGSEVTIGEKTLIRLTTTGRENLQVEQGIVRLKLAEDKPVEVDIDGKTVSISGRGAEIVMNIQEKGSQIGVSSGSAQVKMNEQTQTLTSKELVQISEGIMNVTEKITLFSPMDNEKIYRRSGTAELVFEWASSKEVIFEISKDRSFEKLVKQDRAVSSYQLSLPKGIYYWRVKEGKSLSQVGTFQIIQETSPFILSPQNGEVVRVVDYVGDESVLLSWDAQEDLVDLELKTIQGNQLLEKVSSPYRLPVSDSFDLEWRVKRTVSGRPETIWSDWQKVKILYLKIPERPRELSPVNYEQITYGENPKSIKLQWQGDSPFYVVQIKYGQNIETFKTTSIQYEYILKSPAVYQWRVRAEDEFGRESQFSDWGQFEWRDESTSLDNKAQKIVLKRPSQKVNFSWEDPQGEEVQFELAKDATFKEVVIQKKLKAETTEVTFPDQGTYYWRTQKLTSTGERILSAPKKVVIEPAPAPERPETLPEIEVPLEYIESTYQRSWLDYLIPTAFANDDKLVAPLNWPKKEDAEFYLIEIYTDDEGNNKVHELKTSETNYLWKNPKIGEYYWRWAVIDYWGRVSPFSEFSQLKVTPPKNFRIQKVKLLSPIKKIELPPNKPIRFSWTEVKESENYIFELASDDDFDQIVKKETLAQTSYEVSGLLENDYYWKVTTKKWNQKQESSTGRFSIKDKVPTISSKEETKKESFLLPSSLFILSWVPSLDTFKFETKDAEGDISGNVLVGLKIDYQQQINNLWRAEFSVLHQSGKVFGEENYKFRQTKLGASRRLQENVFVTPTIGLVEYQEYLKQNEKLKAKDQMGFDIGAEIRYEFNYPKNKWDIAAELRGGQVLSYGVSIRHWTENWTQAIILQNRKFDSSGFEGTQTSIRFELGRLFSFDK